MKEKHQPGARWAFMRPMKIVNDVRMRNNKPYLWRLRIVQTPWFGVYLHKINEPDLQDPHDHPWAAFYSIVLWGWYQEALWVVAPHELVSLGPERRGWLSGHRIKADNFHRIYHLHRPTWTLVFVGRRVQQWGFYTFGKGWEPWDSYLANYRARQVEEEVS